MTALHHLTGTPLFGITLTLAVYVGAHRLWERCGRAAALNPVLVSVTAIAALLLVTGVTYEEYLVGGRFIGFLLGPATVALAIPLYRSAGAIRRFLAPVVAAVVAGGVTAILVATGVARVCGGGHALAATLAPKSATTPIALAVAEATGGIGPLTAVLTVLTGVLGAVAGPAVLTLLRVRDERVRGLAMGVSAHGVGTSRALEESPTAGAFSALAMALTGLLTAVLAPPALALLG